MTSTPTTNDKTTELSSGDKLIPEAHNGMFTISKPVSGVNGQDDTTQFTTPGRGVESNIASPSLTNAALCRTMSSNLTQDIRTFLCKPIRAYSGNFSVSDIANTYILSFNPLSYLKSDPFYSKIKGIVGLRATAKIRLTFNGNPFLMGRYMLVWIPTGGAQSDNRRNVDVWNIMHTYTLTQTTQLPHVEFDLNRDTEAVLTVPYVNASAFYSLDTTLNQGSNGDVRVIPYSPLKTASGSSNVAYDIFISFEDVEFGPSVVPQSGKYNRRTRQPKITEEEQKANDIGPVTSISRKISQATDILNKIPIIGDFSAPIGWAADIIGNVASIFGWSNPVILSPNTRVSIDAHAYANNVDVADTSLPLSLFSQNQVQTFSPSPTKLDEMSFAYLLSISSWVGSMDWNTQPDDTLIGVFNCTPRQYTTTTLGATTLYHYTPMGYLSKLHQYYTGSVTFKFKIVCTQFHTGRLLVSFNPINYNSVAANPSITDTYYLNRQVIDLREGHEFTLSMPYVSNRYYLDPDEIYGKVYIHILNQLNYPSTVSSDVKILVEVMGNEDMEFAVPRGNNFEPVGPLFPQSGEPVNFTIGTRELVNSSIGASDLNSAGIELASMCIGEKVISLRTLGKRATWLKLPGSLNAPIVIIQPFAQGINNMDAVGTIITGNDMLFDYYGHFTSMYALSRGGVRLRRVTTNSGDVTKPNENDFCTYVVQNNAGVYPGITTDSLFDFNPMEPIVYTNAGSNIGLEVQIPQYSTSHSRPSASMLYRSGDVALFPALLYGNIGVPRFTCRFQSFKQVYGITRQMSDDCDFAVFTSIPPSRY